MTNVDPVAFHDFEHRGWEEVASLYQDSWSSITTQSIEPILDAVAAGRGVRLLDVACGPGYVAGAAAMRGAIVTGIDFSARMVEEARRRYPSLKFEEGDAEQLAYPDRSFDAVVLNFGMLHLARPESALSETHRVLDRSGRVAFTVWNTPEKAHGFAIVLQAIKKHGTLDVPIPPGPPFFRFSDPEESMRVMREAGFGQVAVTEVPLIWRLPSPDALFTTMYSGSVRNAALLRAQKPAALEAIRQEIRTEVERRGNELPMSCVLVSGRKE